MDILASKDIRTRKIQIAVFDREPKDGITLVAESVVFSPVDEDMALDEPTLSLDYEDAVRLMDELWNCGIRPTEVGSPGELAAVKYHLEDMRRLVLGTQSKE